MNRKKWKNGLAVALCISMAIAGSNVQSVSDGVIQKLAAQYVASTQPADGSNDTGEESAVIRMGDDCRKIMTETTVTHYKKTTEQVGGAGEEQNKLSAPMNHKGASPSPAEQLIGSSSAQQTIAPISAREENGAFQNEKATMQPTATKDPVLEMIAQNQETESSKEKDPQKEAKESPVNDQGEITEPFDQAYPDVFESGDVEYAANSIMIKMKASSVAGAKDALKNAGVGKLERIFKTEDATWYTAYLYKGEDVDKVISKVREIKKVILAEYNFKYETTSVADEVAENPKSGDQWVLNSSGIQDCWKELKDQGISAGGSSSVTVAVIDTGVDYNHEDLKDNIWKNTEEIPNDGIDNDGDGIVDDYYGADMVNGSGSAMDDEGHGTHVAGIIAASNNDKGVVGIAYNTKIMPIKAGDASGIFMQDNIAKAINYAFEKGADVINMSFGGTTSSIAVQDALAMAYSRCVLVASAGNDGMPNEVADEYPTPLPNYPAALSYVMGVMSVGEEGVESAFTNWDTKAFNSKEYEVYAPGEQILSTIPGDRYAKLSGTSMAAPVVAAEAALLRSRYKDMDKYPTKFIYGQISGTVDESVTCVNPEKHTVAGLPHNIPGMVNFKKAMTTMPKPQVGVSDYTIFDTAGYSADTEGLTAGCEEINNGDGVVDAGETIALGFTLRNRWGMSENTKVHIEAKSSSADIDNPYVTFLNNDIDYKSVGTYSENDCGKLYGNDDEEWTGWKNPFYIKIDKNCPNNATITLQVTITCENALDDEDTQEYVSGYKIRIVVRKGQTLPNKITKDTTLTKDNYYIIPSSMIVMEGATLTIEPGTKVQFWSSDAQDSYAETGIAYLKVQGKLICKGTEEEMIELFPSEYMNNFRVEVYATGDGDIDMEYTKVTNPYLYKLNTIKNCEFVQNVPREAYGYRYLEGGKVQTDTWRYSGMVRAVLVQDSSFYQLGSNQTFESYKFRVEGKYNRCIFVDSSIEFAYDKSIASEFTNCVFYGNSNGIGEDNGVASSFTLPQGISELTVKDIVYREETGTTYLSFEKKDGVSNNVIMKRFYELAGLKTAVLDDKEEASYVSDSFGYNSMFMGLTYKKGKIYDCNGKEIPEGIEIVIPNLSYTDNVYLYNGRIYVESGYYGSRFDLAEMPGDVYISDITLDDYLVDMDMDSVARIRAQITPVTADSSKLLYESEDTSVATVSDTGLITPKGQGTTNIKVYSPDKAVWNYVTVNVRESVALEKIVVTPEKTTLTVGETQKLKTTLYPKNTTKRNVQYATSDASVAVVDDRGNVTAKGVGTAKITVSGDGGIKAEAEITCVIPAKELTFDQAVYITSLDQEDGTTFYPTISPADSTDQDLIWSSSNENIAYVNEQGELVKKQNGTVTLRAELKGTKLSADMDLCIQDQISSVQIVKMQQYYDNTRYLLREDGSLWEMSGNNRYPKCIDEIGKIKDFYAANGLYVVDMQGTLKHYAPYTDEESGRIIYKEESNFQELNNVKALNEGWDSSVYAITSSGRLYALGENYYGQLGDDSTNTVWNETVPVALNAKVKKVVSFCNTALILDEDGNVYTTGGQETKVQKPVKIAENAKDIYGDYARYDAYIDCGDTIKRVYYYRSSVDSIQNTYTKNNVNEVYYSNYGDSYYIQDGKVYMRGRNSNGQLGIGTTGDLDNYSEPMKNITDAKKLFWLENTVYVQTESGILYAVGQGRNYFLGNGDASDRSTVQQVPFGMEFSGESPLVETWNASVASPEAIGLRGDKMQLTFNNRIVRGSAYNSIKVSDEKGAVEFSKDMDMQYLDLTFEEELIQGAEYTLTIPAGALAFPSGEQNDDIEITFVYLGADDTKEDISADQTETDEGKDADSTDTDAEEDTTDVSEVHETQRDEELLAQRKYLTKEDVEKLWKQFVDDGYNTVFYSNAIINRLNNDDTETWLRIAAPTSSDYTTIGLGGNYWGTTNQKLIDKQILDFDDFQELADINEGKILTEAPKDTYPFVVDAYLEKENKKVTEVGNDLVTFVVDFNRDMDTSIDLKVGFGSSYPYNDYTVEGSYETPTRWRGTIQLNTLIENGYQCWSVCNGKAAGTSLKLFKDWGRFPFKIDTSSAQALIMQGEATKTGIKLSWLQDDFETLAGYNVYRSKTEDGQYSRLNKTVIPADTKEWFDDTIEPGEIYYYNFTVVKSDMSESEPSGKVSIRALDTMAPDIYHTPVRNVFAGNNLVISAMITDNVKIDSAKLYYRVKGTEEWNVKSMTPSKDKYIAVISSEYVTTDGLEYYISATDGLNVTNRGTEEEPYEVLVQKVVEQNEYGDVDGNGVIELKDALMVLQAANGRRNLTAEEFARADWDQDGELSAKEALRILQYVNGSVSTIVP